MVLPTNYDGDPVDVKLAEHPAHGCKFSTQHPMLVGRYPTLFFPYFARRDVSPQGEGYIPSTDIVIETIMQADTSK
jgi:hypothetical protein